MRRRAAVLWRNLSHRADVPGFGVFVGQLSSNSRIESGNLRHSLGRLTVAPGGFILNVDRERGLLLNPQDPDAVNGEYVILAYLQKEVT